MRERIGTLEKVSYGLGDFSNNGMFTFISAYMMYFCTDVAHLEMTWVSVLLMVGSLVNAIISPVIGILIDKTDTRLGSCRPITIAGMTPVAVSLALTFCVPEDMRFASVVIFILYLIFNISYSLQNVSYSSLLNVLTDDNRDRISLNLFKNIGANLGGIFVTMTTIFMVRKFGGAEAGGFGRTAVLYAILFFGCMLMCVCNTRERVMISRSKLPKQSIISVIRDDRPWQIICAVQFITMTCFAVRNQGSIYFTKYFLGDEQLNSVLLTINSLVCLAMAFILPWIEKQIGLRQVVLYGNICNLTAVLLTYLAGNKRILVILLHVMSSIGWAMATGMIFVIISQTIDFAEYRTGFRPQGIFISLLMFFVKVGNGLAGVICAQILKMGGYAAGRSQSIQSLRAIRFLFLGLPAIFFILVIILMMGYHLDREYPEIQRSLQKKHAMQKGTDK